jgi:hypothetical protein
MVTTSAEVRFYARREPLVEAVQLTEGNAQAVAAWCDGEVRTVSDGRTMETTLHFANHLTAFPGDWVVRDAVPGHDDDATVWMCYPDDEFQAVFFAEGASFEIPAHKSSGER